MVTACFLAFFPLLHMRNLIGMGGGEGWVVVLVWQVFLFRMRESLEIHVVPHNHPYHVILALTS